MAQRAVDKERSVLRLRACFIVLNKCLGHLRLVVGVGAVFGPQQALERGVGLQLREGLRAEDADAEGGVEHRVHSGRQCPQVLSELVSLERHAAAVQHELCQDENE